MSTYRFNKEPLWKPDDNSGQRMKQFMEFVAEERNQTFYDYWDFHKWSVDNIADFWEAVWDFFGVIYSKRYDKVIDMNVPMEDRPEWFEGARLNFAENLLKYRDDSLALLVTGENRIVQKVTYKEMYEETRVYVAALKKVCLKKGDRVACYMSNRKEAIIAMLAVTSMGAIWTGCQPTLGAKTFLNRVKQVKPKILFTIDQFHHNKEIYHLLQNVKEIAEGLPSLQKIVIVPATYISEFKDITNIKNSCFLDDFLESGYNPDGSVPNLTFEQVSFSHPVFINYTSGTTGFPKSIVHGFGGLLSGIRDFCLHSDSRRGDTWLATSPVGWVSWNFMNHILFDGQTLVVFEGVPYFLSPTYLWDMVDDLKVATILLRIGDFEELEAKGYVPGERHNLSSLKMIQTGGSIVKPHSYDFAKKILKPPATLAVSYGSTELMSFCLLSDTTFPLYEGEISTPCLGVQIEIVDDGGNLVTGEIGEFTISKPVPSLPLGLWGDSNGELFIKTYFSKYKGKFSMGDTAIFNPITKGIIICGRSDETMKPKDWRFGSSEIYNIVKYFPEVRDSICVAQHSKRGKERAVLFIQMQENERLNPNLIENLRKKITEELTEYHVPEIILEIPAIPYNVNGKKMEIIVKKIINGMPHSQEAVTNSECLKYYYDVPELQGY